jgi:hypothetical protein
LERKSSSRAIPPGRMLLYASYQKISADDMKALIAFLRRIPARE